MLIQWIATSFRAFLFGTSFFKRYKLIIANNDFLLQQVFKMRHKVFSEQLGWESKNSEALERDIYDSTAKHVLLWCKKRKEYVASARLVIKPEKNNNPLPSEFLYSQQYSSSAAATMFPQNTFPIGEISRVLVLQESKENLPKKMRVYPVLGLYMGILALAKKVAVENIYMLCELPIIEQIQSLTGVRLTLMGDPLNHRGERRIVSFSLRKAVLSLSREKKLLFNVMNFTLSL
ncbi:MAG: GNAT family N-acetyltransferase [Proteobacteria bacterium]|nr:GNAT family N-acetyltransferase [Pseudomonadota bacterium]